MHTTRLDAQAPTFGISLRLLCERSGIEVPLILGDILRWLAAHALAQPDVFAQHSRSAATRNLKCAIDSGIALSEIVEGTHPAVVGSFLKRWLEELPDPLLNWDQQVELLSACKDEGCIEARIASLNDAVALVDPISLGTLKPLLLFLQQYCFRQRRFDQQLLQVAVAFAPILFPAALAAGPAELRLAEETVATLVSNALHVFNPTLAANVPVVTPQALSEAAAEVTAMESSHQDHQQKQQQQQQQLRPVDHEQTPQQAVRHLGQAAGMAVKSAATVPNALRAQQPGGHFQGLPADLVDDVALMSIDQRLPQRQVEQQQRQEQVKAPQQQASVVSTPGQVLAPATSGRPGTTPQEAAAQLPACLDAQLLTVRRDDGVDGAPDAATASSYATACGGHSAALNDEPCLCDAAFLASLDFLVDCCVASALFPTSMAPLSSRESDSQGGEGFGGGQWHTAREHASLEELDEHCGSLAPSACPSSDFMSSSVGGGSATSSTGGKSSSGGGSAASCEEHDELRPSTAAAAAAAGPMHSGGHNAHQSGSHRHRHSEHHHHGHHQGLQQQHRHGGSRHAPEAGTGPEQAPYSPRAVLITLPKADDPAVASAAPVVVAPDPLTSGPGVKAGAPAPVPAAALAELAHREVSEGSVICIISAGPGSGPIASGLDAAGVLADTAGHAMRAKQQQHHHNHQLGAAKGATGTNTAPKSVQQRQQHESAPRVGTAPMRQAADVQSGSVGSDAAGDWQSPGQSHFDPADLDLHQLTVGPVASAGRHLQAGGANGAMLPRRMTMGGGEAVGPASPTGPVQQQHQQPPQQQHLIRSGPGGNSHCTSSASRPQSQHQPHQKQQPLHQDQQAPHRTDPSPCGPRASGGAPAGHGPSQTTAAVSAVSAALHGHHSSGLPAPAPPPGGAPSASGHIAELGVAGHLRVSLTGALTLAVRELSTPEALAHRVPIRTLAAPALQAEKERLKRQLKDVAAAYESLAGQALVPALKEPLRPVYVRYHKIKALLNSGRAAATGGQQQGASGSAGAGAVGVVSSSRLHQASRA